MTKRKINNYIFSDVVKFPNEFVLMRCNKITIDNNFIIAFKEKQKLGCKGFFNLIMFENCIFHVTAIPEIFNKFKTVI